MELVRLPKSPNKTKNSERIFYERTLEHLGKENRISGSHQII